MKSSISVFALMITFFFSSATNLTLSDDVAGAWDYTVNTPDGTYQGQMIFTKVDDGYSGKMVSQGGETALKDLNVENNEVSFSLYVEGYLVKIKGAIEGDVFAGKVEVESEFYPIKGVRVVEDLLAGTWDYTADTQEGAYKGQFVFTNGGENYSGKMISQGNETELKDIKVEEGKVSFTLYTEGYLVKVKGAVEGKYFNGKGEVEGETFPVKAQKAE